MAVNPGAVLAAINGGGTTGASLCFVGPVGTAAPTTATSALNAAFKDCGLTTVDGLTDKIAETVKQINAFGVQAPILQITTDTTETFDIAFMESNETVIELFNRKTLGSVVPATTDGAMSFTTGQAATQFFAAVFDIVMGANHIRIYAPKCQVTNRKDQQYQNGTEITYPMEITALLASDGTATTRFMIVDALKT